jgi:tetratricopeptide (TPR) repeat protein
MRARVSVGLLLLAGSLSACGGDNGAAAIARGDAYLKEGKVREATLEFETAVQADNRNGEARYKLGLAMAQIGNDARALDHLVRAADLLPDNVDVQLEAAKVLLKQGRYEDARSRAEGVLRIDSRNIMAHTLRATATAGMNDVNGAIQSLTEAAKLDPDRSETLIDLAVLEFSQGKLDEAEAGFKQAAQLAPKSPDPLLALAGFYYKAKRIDDAEATLKRALVLEPDHIGANQALAGLYRTTNRPKLAEGPLKRLADAGDDPAAKLALADYYIAEMRPDEARALLSSVSSLDAASAAAQARLAALDYQAGNRAAAYKALDAILAKEPNNAGVMVVRAGWLLSEGKYDDARAIAVKATQQDPRSVDAHSLLGTIHIQRNDPVEAIKAYTTVLQIRPDAFRAQVALAGLHLATGRREEARRFAQQAVANAPNVAGPKHALARVAFAEGNLAEAERELAPVLAAAPNSVDALNLRGQIRQRRGDLTPARLDFQRALELSPRSVEALAGLATLDIAQKRPGDAVKRLEDAVGQGPANPRLLLVAGRAHAFSGKLTEAEQFYRKALQADPTLMEAYDALGQLYVKQNKLEEARQAYERQSTERPNDVAAHTMVARILYVQGKPDESRARFEKILSIDPRAAVAANNLAYMDAEAGTNLDIALNRAQIAKAAQPDDPDVNDTLGWVYVRRGLPALAFAPLEVAIQKSPSNPLYHYHLGMAYVAAKDNDRARPALQRALQLNPSFEHAGDAKKALASLGR